jgi:hypothetical protein
MSKKQFQQIMQELAEIKQRLTILENNSPIGSFAFSSDTPIVLCAKCQGFPCICNTPIPGTFDVPV